MIDKSDLRVPATTPWNDGFRVSRGGIFFRDRSVGFKRTQYYEAVADLRPLGLDAFLHMNYRFHKRKDHKLELIGVGKKTLQEMDAIIGAIFEVESCKLLLIRLDLTADIPDIPVEYLRHCMRVARKRKTDELGLEYEAIGDRQLQYLRWGRAPNLIRAYDKTAHRLAQFEQMLKHVSGDAEIPSFQETFGTLEDAVVTRVEKQIGGGRIPSLLATFGDLKNAAAFDPFSNVEVIPGNVIPIPDPHKYSPAETIKILGIRELIEREGLQNAFARLNRGHNARRPIVPYNRYLQDCGPAFQISREHLTATFRTSVMKQIQGVEHRITDTRDLKSQGDSIWAA